MMYDRLCDLVCLGLAAQRGNQLTREIQCAADAAAGDNLPVGDCVFLFRGRTLHAVLHARIAGRLFAFEQAHAAQNDGRSRADCRNVLACICHRANRISNALVRVQIGRARHAARQNQHICRCEVNLVHGQVGYDIDAACTAHGCTGHTDQSGFHACAAQKIDRSQRLDFLEALCQ